MGSLLKEPFFPGAHNSNTMYGSKRYRSSSGCRCATPSTFSERAGSLAGDVVARGVSGIGKWLGWGDYTLNTNSLVKAGGVVPQDAKILPQGDRAVRVIYREYLGDVYTHPSSAGAFSVQTFQINPGLFTTFPWLSTIANQYEQWTPNGIVFEFKSTSSDYTATSALGSVIMATDYDQLDSVYANKQEMLNSAYSNEAKPTEHIVHGLECAPGDTPQRLLYTRSGALTGPGLRDTDLAQFSIATQGGTTANLNLGSLYVYYDITLRKEQLFGGVLAKGNLFYTAYLTTGIDALNPFGSVAPTLVTSNMVQPSPQAVLLNAFRFNKAYTGARFWVSMRYFGTAAAVAVPTITFSNGATLVASVLYCWTGTIGFCGFDFVVDIENAATTSSPQFAITGGTYPTSITGANLLISQVSKDFNPIPS